MDRKIQVCLGAIFFFASWTHAYSIGPYATIPNVLIGVCLVLFFVGRAGAQEHPIIKIRSEDLSLLVFVAITVVSCVAFSNSKTTNYLFAYLFSFVFFAIVVREIIVEFGSSVGLLNANLAGIVFVSIFTIAEFFLNVFLQFDVQDYVVRTTPADALYFIFPRVYGFSEEPTYLAWYYNTLGPVGMVYLWTTCRVSAVLRTSVTFIFICGYVLTFSAAGPIFLLLAAVVAGVAQLFQISSHRFGKRSSRAVVTSFGLVLSTLVIFVFFSSNLDGLPVSEFFDRILEKITLSQSNVDARAPKWSVDLARSLSQPLLGQGPGYLSSVNQHSSLNLFIFVALEQGVIAAAALLLFYLSVGMRIWMAKIPYKKAILTGYCAGVFHLFTMTQHYHPCLWLLIALAYLMRKENEVSIHTND